MTTVEPIDRDDLSQQLEAARWRGEMEARMNEGDGRFTRLERTIDSIDSKLDDQANEFASIKTKVALYGAIGGLAGSVIVGLVIAIGTNAIGL